MAEHERLDPALSPPMSLPPNILPNWRAELFAFAFHQGPSFVVLLLLLVGGWQASNHLITEGVPAHLEQIKAGYREIQASHTANLERVIATFEREQAKDREVVDILSKLVENKQFVRDNHDLLVEVVESIRSLKPPK